MGKDRKPMVNRNGRGEEGVHGGQPDILGRRWEMTRMVEDSVGVM